MHCSELLISELIKLQLFTTQSRKKVLNQHLQANQITKIEVAVAILV